MTDCNPTRTPYTSQKQSDINHTYEKLSPSRVTRYRKILGEIRYITDSTRPDIAYITNKLAQNMNNPTTEHEQSLKTLLRYLKGTRTHGLLYAKMNSQETESQPLRVYSDADFANAKNRKSISGNVHYVGSTPISWLSQKQSVVALSTTEAEYISATQATQHTNWIQNILAATEVTTATPAPHYIDNRSAIIIAENKAPTKRRKYIDLRHHYLQHHVAQGAISLHRIPTNNMTADIFTKPLARERFEKLRKELQVVFPPLPRKKCDTTTGDCQSAT